MFGNGMIWVGYRKRKGVGKRRLRFRKTDLVLRQISGGFIFVPFKSQIAFGCHETAFLLIRQSLTMLRR